MKLREDLRNSFTFRIFISFTVSTVLVWAAFTAFFIYQKSRTLHEDLMKQGNAFAGFLSESSRAGVFAENVFLLKDAVRGVLRQKDVLSASVYASNAEEIFGESKGGGMSPVGREERHFDNIMGAISSGTPLTVERKGSLDFFVPVAIETFAGSEEGLYFEEAEALKRKVVIGCVRVSMDKGAVGREIRSIIVSNSVVAALVLLGGTLLTFIVLKRVTRPLIRLTEAVKTFGSGEAVEPVAIKPADEIGRLAAAFDHMAEGLKKREEEKEQLEERLRQAQKLEAVGTLARGIAHDFNNILTTVQGSVYILEKKLFGNDPLLHYTDQIQSSLARAKALIQGLLTFSRVHRINPSAVDVDVIVGRMRPVLMNIAGEKVDVRFLLGGDGITVRADPLQLEQVLMNLALNSVNAMPDGGTLTVETGSVSVGDDNPAFPPGNATGQYAVIRVADTGIGMDEETKERIFEPYFTTREVGKGTGLGLAIVYGIINQHKGHIQVESKKGEGSTFSVYIPLSDADGDGDD